MKPSDEGNVQRPALSGDRPSTNCRYCAIKKKVPNTRNRLSVFAARDALNAGVRKRRRSISGSASLCWRRTNASPIARPARIDSVGTGPKPFWASSLMP